MAAKASEVAELERLKLGATYGAAGLGALLALCVLARVLGRLCGGGGGRGKERGLPRRREDSGDEEGVLMPAAEQASVARGDLHDSMLGPARHRSSEANNPLRAPRPSQVVVGSAGESSVSDGRVAKRNVGSRSGHGN